MKRILIAVLLLALPSYALKLSVGGSHLVGVHYEFDASDDSIVDTSVGMFEWGTVIVAASHEFLYPLNGHNDLYIGYGAMCVGVPSLNAYMFAAKLPFGWRYTFQSGNIFTLGIDLNYLLVFTRGDGKWSSDMNIDPPIVPFPFIAYSF